MGLPAKSATLPRNRPQSRFGLLLLTTKIKGRIERQDRINQTGMKRPSWTGAVHLAVEPKLLEPLSWRSPRLVFVNNMSDFARRARLALRGARRSAPQALFVLPVSCASTPPMRSPKETSAQNMAGSVGSVSLTPDYHTRSPGPR